VFEVEDGPVGTFREGQVRLAHSDGHTLAWLTQEELVALDDAVGRYIVERARERAEQSGVI
jgi:hypothetical protein